MLYRSVGFSRIGRACVIFLATFSSVACETIGQEARNAVAARPALTDGLGDAPFNLAIDCMPAGRLDDGRCVLPPLGQEIQGSTYLRISYLSDPAAQATWRNRLQDYLIWRSDKLCQRYKAGLTSTQSGVNFTLNTLTTGVAAVAAVVVAPATNILGAVGAITSGTRGHFNEDFYQRFIAPAIIKAIDKSRSTSVKNILARRGVTIDTRPTAEVDSDGRLLTKGKETQKIVLMESYSLEEAIADVERYHQLCSATEAIGTLTKDDVKFSDTATGIKERLILLRSQQKANTTQIEELKKRNIDLTNTAAINRLAEANADLSKQIVVLQQQLLTAPISTD